jgi:Uma2 family endonuclease
MPKFSHALSQGLLFNRLHAWGRTRGRVGTEWRFWVTPAGSYARYLVPDVAYLSYARLPRESVAEAEEPHVAPSAVFEIRSPSDRNILVEHKVDVYLRAGADVVCIIDPKARTAVLHDAERVRFLGSSDLLVHDALPGFEVDLAELFAELDP